jgi:hypothetical protein
MHTNTLPRRSMIARIGAMAVGALALRPSAAAAQARGGRFQPLRHAQDDWLDAVPGGHRTFIDAATVNGAGEAILYANNLYVANKSGYALDENRVAVVVCLRHFATAFAFNDAIWAKYGKVMSTMLNFTDPKTK